MKKISVFAIIFLITMSISIPAFALQQVAGNLEANVSPGESQTLEWGLISDNPSQTITVEIIVEGSGSEYLSFPDKAVLQPGQLQFIEIVVSIPNDYDQSITLNPIIYAIEKGETGGATVINTQMKKILTLNIINEKPEIEVVPTPEITGQDVTTQTTEINSETLQPTCGQGTELVNGICQIIQTEEKSKGGGCLIATATYGSELAPQVQQLREIRDNSLLQTASGTSFMNSFNDFYYSFSPTVADWERENPAFKEFVKITLTPMISSLSILNYVDMDSESNVLGYGISLILLNVGMYFVAPAIIIVGIKKRF